MNHYKFYVSNNDSPETWAEETGLYSFEYLESLCKPVEIKVIIIDPENTKQSTYNPYRRVKLVEKISEQTLFIGRIETCEPRCDSELGQIIEICCFDYFKDLAKVCNEGEICGKAEKELYIRQKYFHRE